MTTGPTRPPPGQVLVVNADPALTRLIGEWLSSECLEVPGNMPPAGACSPAAIVADLPCSRQAGVDLVRELAQRYPGVPIVALSSSFFPHVQGFGALARELGAACVMAKPTTRDALVAALRRLRCC